MQNSIFNGKNHSEITDVLAYLDLKLMMLHQEGKYLFRNSTIYENNSDNQDVNIKDDIEYLVVLGICAYNHFDDIKISHEFIYYLKDKDNLLKFLENGNVPKYMKDYYIDVLLKDNVDYLYNFLLQYDNNGKGNSRSKVYSKNTAAGRALRSDEAAYANVMIFPAILILIIIVFLVSYMIFVR